jgi:hypothetical protein
MPATRPPRCRRLCSTRSRPGPTSAGSRCPASIDRPEWTVSRSARSSCSVTSRETRCTASRCRWRRGDHGRAGRSVAGRPGNGGGQARRDRSSQIRCGAQGGVADPDRRQRAAGQRARTTAPGARAGVCATSPPARRLRRSRWWPRSRRPRARCAAGVPPAIRPSSSTGGGAARSRCGGGVGHRTGAPGALAVVSDLGLRFAVPTRDVLAVLGYPDVTPQRLPAGLVALVPSGRALDPPRPSCRPRGPDPSPGRLSRWDSRAPEDRTASYPQV